MKNIFSSPGHLQSVGQRIRYIRERRNWSQARLAQELDKYDVRVSISSINRWENDKVVPGPYY
ncbi:MAG: helix-turn-helix transcriptional regulator, partial [Ktedonobacteraceae bacterium]|nr:helix-turn-helix transcriptional regulator [Ktedonobacteraceae bacterium]